MQKLIRNEKLLLFAAVSSALTGAFSIAGIIFFIMKLMYVPMAACILVCAHGFYGCPLYLMRRADLKLSRNILSGIEEGIYEVSTLAERVGVKRDFAAKLILSLIKKGYLSDFTFDGEALLPTVK